MTKLKRNRIMYYPFLVFILFVFRNFIRYILYLFGQEQKMAYIYYPGDTGFVFDIFIGILILYIDIREYEIQYYTREIRKNILKIVVMVFFAIFVMRIWPYELVNSMIKNWILDPVFSFFMNRQPFVHIVRMKEEEIDILYETFLWHFYMTEGTFLEVMIIYVSFTVGSILNILYSKYNKRNLHY